MDCSEERLPSVATVRSTKTKAKAVSTPQPLLGTDEKFFETGLLADLNGDGHADFASVDVMRRNLLLFPGDGKGGFSGGRHRTRSNRTARWSCRKSSPPATSTATATSTCGWPNTRFPMSAARCRRPTTTPTTASRRSCCETTVAAASATSPTKPASKKRLRRTYGSSFVDLDDDGDLDLLVVSDFSGIDIYHNDGQGKFTDVTTIASMNGTISACRPRSAISTATAGSTFTSPEWPRQPPGVLEHLKLGRSDVPDVHKMRPMMGYGSRMYLAVGDGRFAQPEFREQVNRTGWTWGSSNFDFDNDGDRDIFVGNGHSSGQSTKDHCSHFWCHDIYTNDSAEDAARNNLFNQISGPYFDRRESWDGYQKNVL